MFYVPEEQNDEYSEGFRKMVNRVLNKLRKQSEFTADNFQRSHHISSTINYANIHMKKRKQLFQDKKYSNFSKEHTSSGLKDNSNRIFLPKLQTPGGRIAIRGQQLSSKFIRSSEKQIANMLGKISRQQSIKQYRKQTLEKKKRDSKARKLKSQCIQQLQYLKLRKSSGQEQIAPWELNITSTNFFQDDSQANPKSK